MIAVVGAGAFGTALAITLARTGSAVTLVGRDVGEIAERRENARYLPGVALPEVLGVADDLRSVAGDVVLLAMPMQRLAGYLGTATGQFEGKRLVACCKGVDLGTGLGPTGVIAAACPTATPALLTGPSFADDIASGLPTALTLACADRSVGRTLQDQLSGPTLRLYCTTDTTGAELGGALKNVIALASGMTIGAGLAESARAAVITRGYAEMIRFATAQGARAETLAGLSGLGDLVLTATSSKSRNYTAGVAMGAGDPPAPGTVEGIATAKAVARLAKDRGIDMPLTGMVAAVVSGTLSVEDAKRALLARPLKEE
ncbi:MAG: NAD(P)H-dependent glycerol-3-phosphate dehydrogenase [Pseudomonadota bacterium]